MERAVNIDDIISWPGKSDPTTSLMFPAAWHMLDVGACARLLIRHHGGLQCLLEPHRQALILLIVFHDLGKFSASFCTMLKHGKPQTYKHWELSALLLHDLDHDLEQFLGGVRAVRAMLCAAVAGHHGGPAEMGEEALKFQAIGDTAKKAARAFITEVFRLFPKASLTGLSEKDAHKISWLLSGLSIQSDWLGSSTRWFPLKRSYDDFAAAWKDACARAKQAVQEAGLVIAKPSPFDGGRTLCDLATLHPMQKEVEKLPLADGPMLALIEDATGAGKTESALILAHRMIHAGKANGFFFALPSMATANAIFERVGNVVSKLFETPPSIVLAHSRSSLNTTFQAMIGQDISCSDDLSCSQWLADDRRLSLLAEIGVGTVDQLLMSILPVRFNTLRLWGLSQKVVIIDEAHSYDPYMERELATFLRFHALLGGSAIVMTATLPQNMRTRFAKAFQTGLGVVERRAKPIETKAYPALSVVSREVTSKPVAPVPATRRRVRVTRLADAQAAVELLDQARSRGAACLWVRNAVDDAIAAVEFLREKGVDADLLHARFTMWDRLQHEQAAQNRFGRGGQGRSGRVLVATQVVEASLDLDFDVMVSDLAPMGSLLQRVGRLWRHMSVRPVEIRPDNEPVLHVLSPDPAQVNNDRWLHQVLGGGAWVYKQDQQWRTAKVLFDAGEINAPDGLRTLIEAVHGDHVMAVPDPLKTVGYTTQGIAMSERAQAGNAVLDAAAPFAQPQNMRVFSDENFPTRLGEPQVTLLLTRSHNDVLTPWATVEKPPQALALSEVQVSQLRFDRCPGHPDQTLPKVLAFKKDWPQWKQDRVIVAIVDEQGRICEGLQYNHNVGLLME